MGDTPETVMTTKAPAVLKKSHIVLETQVPKCKKWYKPKNHLFVLFFVDGSDKVLCQNNLYRYNLVKHSFQSLRCFWKYLRFSWLRLYCSKDAFLLRIPFSFLVFWEKCIIHWESSQLCIKGVDIPRVHEITNGIFSSCYIFTKKSMPL